MKIAYNPKTGAALTTAPANNDITFDLSGLNIFVRGEKFKGTDTTYSVFKKHTSSSGGGYNGLVPVPSYTTTNIRFLREDGTWKSIDNYQYTQITNQDLNTLKTEGKWYYAGGGNATTNKPSGVDAYELYVGRNANGYRYQKLTTSDGKIWFRYYNASSWTSWVRWYTDANTDQKVLQSASTTANFRPVVLGYNNNTDKSVLANNVTNQVYTTTTIYAQPSTGALYATKFIGKIDWNNIDGKPSSFTPATHYHSYLKGWSDTKNVATTPNDYNGYFKVVGIKTAGATLGLTSTQAGSYATMIGWRGWSDSSGGYAWEIASTDKNRLYVRSGSTTSWNNGWSAIAYTTDTYPTSQINKLTGYEIATSVAALATTDTLNTALGKIEYKLNIAYDLVTKANDSDGTIENLKEILDVLAGIKDTETIQSIVGKYLPLAGGTLTGNLWFGAGNTNKYITFTSETTGKDSNYSWRIGYLGTGSGDGNHFVLQSTKSTTNTWTTALSITNVNLTATFAGQVTATSGVQIGSTADIGWYLNSSRICAGNNIARGVNVGSLLISNAWADSSKVPTNGIYSKGNVSAAGFVKASSSNSYVLLGGGGHKALSDFMLKSEELTTNLTTISKSLTVTQAWMDTGITSTNLPANGTYIVQIQVNADDSTGNMYSCYSSGVMSWYKDATNDTETDEIILHRSGHAYGKIIYLRTVMQSSGVLKLQIGASSNIGQAYTYTFKFKRII